MSLVVRVERVLANGQESDFWLRLDNFHGEHYHALFDLRNGVYAYGPEGNIIDMRTGQTVTLIVQKEWIISALQGMPTPSLAEQGVHTILTPAVFQVAPVYLFTLNVTLA